MICVTLTLFFTFFDEPNGVASVHIAFPLVDVERENGRRELWVWRPEKRRFCRGGLSA